jgi:endonuclease/exonuclease/phosphatase family metal-dependent hydrolase
MLNSLRRIKLLFSVILVILTTLKMHSQKINVMTFNIRLETPNDGLNQWKYRKDKVADMLFFYDVDICGMQEVLYSQIKDLSDMLPGWAYAGKGRDDGETGGEFSPVFYRKDKFEHLLSNTFWLSTSPEKPGKSWDAAINRVVTWVKLREKTSGKEFFVFNSHFDHIGREARKESALLLTKKIRQLAGNHPVILTGDFNSTPDDQPYGILNAELSDSRNISLTPAFGPESTFNGFAQSEFENMRIDYIFVSNGIKVLKYATLSHTWGGRFASDHHPVLARIQL